MTMKHEEEARFAAVVGTSEQEFFATVTKCYLVEGTRESEKWQR